jgi:hypothetical protein
LPIKKPFIALEIEIRTTTGGHIAEATIRAVVENTAGVRLQVDFGHDQTALVELWQVVDE